MTRTWQVVLRLGKTWQDLARLGIEEPTAEDLGALLRGDHLIDLRSTKLDAKLCPKISHAKLLWCIKILQFSSAAT